jgi:heptosyltransferase III
VFAFSAARVWVFHRGALGDSVLLWPRLRAETRAGREVVLVTDGEKARLAQRELGVRGVDAESARFNALWREGASVETVQGVERAVCAGGGGDPEGVWARNVRRMFPGAALEVIGRPSRALYREADAAAGVAVRENPGGPLVVHVGAGSEEKRWGMERWAEVVWTWRGGRVAGLDRGSEVVVIAGEVERERCGARERAIFEELGGRFIGDLLELAEVIKGARVFVGCDSGPTHLAAALGVKTIALFGPTDPEEWGPIGPRVRVVASPTARSMEWLTPERTGHEIAASFASGRRVERSST